ncbi:MAG: DUF4399 domain-containing protein [Gammaproteobacteria bacterium]|nr:DUF4399 domain-containing protein [Gammaproteobacteria bacterium]
MRTVCVALLVLGACVAHAEGIRTAAPVGASVYFISPADGDTLPATFVVRFGLRGMGVAPAGVDVVDTGHHHLLIDVAEMPNPELPLPASDQVVHFGKGQTETQVTLAPGVHTLRLVLGNYLHVPHDPPVASETITVTVQ